jgi:hypothetical protein
MGAVAANADACNTQSIATHKAIVAFRFQPSMGSPSFFEEPNIFLGIFEEA